MNEQDIDKQSIKLEDLLVLGTSKLTHEQKKSRVDLLSTLLLSLSAVLSALSVYQASRWYSEMNVNLGESSTIRAEAARDDRNANRTMLVDMMLFMEWADQYRQKDTVMTKAIQDRFSESLKRSFSVWMGQESKGAAGLLPKGTPFDLAEYNTAENDESKRLVDQSDQKFEKAKQAAQIGDDFIFSLVIFSLSLFFGAVCTKIDLHIFQAILLWLGILIMFCGIFIISQLSWNFGF